MYSKHSLVIVMGATQQQSNRSVHSSQGMPYQQCRRRLFKLLCDEVQGEKLWVLPGSPELGPR